MASATRGLAVAQEDLRFPPGAPATSPSVPPRASIVVTCYNGREHLGACLRSVLSESSADHEVILVDNASTDGSAEFVEQAFPAVRLIRNSENLGFGRGSNLGAHQSRAKYLAFLNQDTVVEPGWLEALILALAADPQAGLATSKILMLSDPERINACGNDMHLTGLTLCRGMGRDRRDLTDLAEVSAVSGAAFAMRRDLYEALGGYDEQFFLYLEDSDISLRARLAGYRCIYVPSSVIYHDYALRFGPRKTFYQERNRWLMLLKTLRWRTLAVLLPALLLAEVVTWGFVLLKERRHQANKLQAYVWLARHWRQIMASRRQTQTLRKVGDRDLIESMAYRLDYGQTGVGAVSRFAHLVFDPLFFVSHRLALGLIRR